MPTYRTGPLLLLIGLAAVSLACGGTDDGAPSSSDDDLTAADTATVAAATGAKNQLYVRLGDAPSSAITDALIAAAKRGVETRAILTPGSTFETSWRLQQHMESSGVDVDVRTDHLLDDVVAFADDTALVPSGTTLKKVTGAPAQTIAKRFTDVLDVAPSSHDDAFLAENAVAVHPMPESKHDRIVALIGAAKTSIDLSIYQLQDRAVVRALADAAGRHVAVRVMLEPKTVGAANYDAVSKELANAGVKVQATPPRFDSSHNVDHAKFAVLDEKEMLFATGNLVRSGLGGAASPEYDNRDFWVEDTRDASVKAAEALFEADWSRNATPKAATSDFVLTPENADDQLTALIDAAKQRLFVYNQSFGDADVIARLVAAKKRGVDVKILLGYQAGFGGAPPDNQDALDKLKAAGIDAAYLRKHYLHAKAIVSDDRVYIGSQNFTNGGLRANRELGMILDDGKSVDAVASAFASDQQQ